MRCQSRKDSVNPKEHAGTAFQKLYHLLDNSTVVDTEKNMKHEIRDKPEIQIFKTFTDKKIMPLKKAGIIRKSSKPKTLFCIFFSEFPEFLRG
jgi:hypothetical protein